MDAMTTTGESNWSSRLRNIAVALLPWLEEEGTLLPYQEAALLLQYARDGQELDGSVLTLRKRACYRIRHKFQWLARLAAWGMLLLHIFERPKWTYLPSREDSWKDHEQYPSFEMEYLNPVAVIVLSVACLCVLWWTVCMEYAYKRHTRNVVLTYVAFAVVTVKSVFVLGCLIKLGLGKDPTFSASPVEALMCLLVEPSFDNNIGYIRRTVPKFALLMLVVASCVAAYTCLAFQVFHPHSHEAEQFFPTFGTGFWTMLMVLNASSWPAPMLPGINENRLYCVFFYSYILLVTWGMLNLVMGFVCLFFQQEQDSIFASQEATFISHMATAFSLMDEERKGYLTYTHVDRLLEEMYDFYEEASVKPTAAERYELILILDTQSNLMIDESDLSCIEDKCRTRALKELRSKKRKFVRFVSAAILRERLYAQPHTGSESPSATALTQAAGEGAAGGSVVSPLQLDGHRGGHGPGNPLGTGAHRDAADSEGSVDGDLEGGATSFPISAALLHTPELARSHAAALARRAGFEDPRFKATTARSESVTSSASASMREERLCSAIEGAVEYAGELEDPKLLDLYRSIQTTELMQQNSAGPTVAQRLAYVSLLLDSVYVDMAVDSFMLVLGIALLTHPTHSELSRAYMVLSLIEMTVKLTVKGRHRYWSGHRTRVDGLVAVGLLVLAIGDASVSGRGYSLIGTKSLVLLRTLCFPRNFIATNGFKAFRARHRLAFEFAFQGASHFSFLLVTLLVLMYMFASVGVRIFGGAICTSGPGSEAVASSDFGKYVYYPLNFNDMPSGMATMFILLSVNNTHIIASGFVAAYSQWAEVFFALWYAVGVLLMLNVLTAVFVNQYTGYISRLAIEGEGPEKGKEGDAAEVQKDGKEDGEEGFIGVEEDPVDATLRKSAGAMARGSLRLKVNDGVNALKKLLTVEEGPPKADRDSFGRTTEVAGVSKSAPLRIVAKQRRGSQTLLPPQTGTPANTASSPFLESRLLAESRAAPTALSSSYPAEGEGGGTGRPTSRKFEASLFASDSDRRKLQDWVQSHYPQQRKAADTEGPTAVSVSPPRPRPAGPLSAGAAALGRSAESMESKRAAARLTAVGEEGEEEETEGDAEGQGSGKSNGSATARARKEKDAPKRPLSQNRSKEFELTPCSSRKGSDANSDATDTVVAAMEGIEGRAAALAREDTGTTTAGSQEESTPPVGSEQAAPDLKAAFLSNQEELRRLREEKDRGMLFPRGMLQRSSAREKALQDWMHGAKDIAAHERAAVLIQFARDGEEHSIHASSRGLACYRLRTHLTPLFRVASLLIVLLKFFERPIWTYYKDEWSDGSVFPTSGIPQLSATIVSSIKLPLLLVLVFGLVLEVGYKEADFTSLVKRIGAMRLARQVLLLYAVVQVVLVLGALAGHHTLLPISSAGTILYVLWFNRRSLHKLRIVLRVVPHLSLVLLVFLVLVCLLAACGPFLFNLRRSGEDDDMHQVYFDTFKESAWSVFVAITSSNYPNQIMPAYRATREVIIFVFAVISLGAFFMLNLVLVTVLVEFQKSLQLAADIQKASRTVLLLRAFEVLDSEGKGYVERSQVQLLLDELYTHYADFRKSGVPHGAARVILIDILDIDGDGRITVPDFLFFLEVTRIKVRQDGGDSFLVRHFPSFAASKVYRIMRQCVEYTYFNLIVDTVAALMIIISLAVNSRDSYAQTPSSIGIAYTLIELLCFDALVKILVEGWSQYKSSFRNRIDFALAFGSLFCLIGAVSYADASRVNGFTLVMRVLLMFRLVIYPRNLRYFFESRGLKRFARLLRRILSKILTLGIVFMCLGYFFATLGVFLFGGLINKDPDNNPRYDDMINSRYGKNGFYPLNFNDFTSACITLFSCLHVSDFDTITSGFTSTSTGKAKLYFAAWYAVGVLFMLNILKSFFLGEFLALFLVPQSGADAENAGEAQDGDDELASDAGSQHTGMTEDYRQSRFYMSSPVPGGRAQNPLTREQRLSTSSTAGPSRQSSVQRMQSLQRSASLQRTPSMYGNPATQHEYDESLYQTIALQLHTAANGKQSATQAPARCRYVASTAKVKNLDLGERQALRRRILQLASSEDPAATEEAGAVRTSGVVRGGGNRGAIPGFGQMP